MVDIAGIRSEIQNDPASLNYAALVAASDDQGIADLMNSTLEPVLGWVKRNDFLVWSAPSVRAKIEDAANDPADSLRSSALVLRSICNGATDGIDFSRAENTALLDAWESSGKISPSEKNALLTKATRNVPRSEMLFGQIITANHVAQAVRDDVGTSLIT